MRNKRNKRELAVFIVMLVMLVVVVSMAIAGIVNLNINNGATDVRSDVDLNCYWTIDASAFVNVTWYRNGVSNITSNISCVANQPCTTAGTSGTVSQNYTTRGDVWTCSVMFYNGTGAEKYNTSVNIVDSPPTQPRVFWNTNGSEIVNTTVNILEDNTTLFNVTSTDADNDPITFTINDTTFCNIGSSSGMLSCNPTLSRQAGVWVLEIDARAALATTGIYFFINVTPVNDPPYFSPGLASQNLVEGQAFNYVITGDDEEQNVPYNVTIVNTTPSLSLNLTRINSSAFMLMLDTNRTATYSEAGNNYTVILNISDTDNLTFKSRTSVSSFTLVGIRHNHLPNVTYIVYNSNGLIQGGNLSIYVNATDLDEDTLTFFTNSTLYNITYNSNTTIDNSTNTSSAYAWINTTLNNNNVIYHSFTLYAFDTKENTTQTIILNINNTNDPPFIYDTSYNPVNTLNNTNITNLTAYTGVLFKYQINASDIDDLTYDAVNTGLGTYSTNDSNFPINATNGLLYFIPNSTGNYSIKVTVTDNGGLSYNKTAKINVLVNTNPKFTQQPIIIYCNETDSVNWPYNCYYNISANTTDQDIGDYIANYWTNSTFFTINSTSGIINFSVSQSMIGNNSMILNVTDTHGGMNTTTIYLIVNNTNNPPNINTPNMPAGNLVVGNVYQITFNASDLDLLLPNTYENLTFIMNTTGPNTGIFSMSQISSTQAVITISPTTTSDAGNYSINFTVTDYYNNKSVYKIASLFIFNQTTKPQIIQIIPSGTPYNSTINNDTWRNTSDFSGMNTTITISENSTYLFNETSNFDNVYPNFLNYTWYYDNISVSSSSSYQKYFDFFSSGNHVLGLTIADQYGSNNSFTWNIVINNVDRAPIYYSNSLENLTIGGSIEVADYMTYRNSLARFYDPDDDPTGKGYNLGNETTMNFSATFCSYADFSFQNSTLIIFAKSIGSCAVVFTATDGLNKSLNVSSQFVLVNVTNVSQDSSQIVQQPVNTQTTGGGTNTQPIPIPLPQEVEKPKPLQILTPSLVTIYQNATIKIPITVNNTWNDTLTGISIDAYTNASNVTLSLDRNYIDKLDAGQGVDLTLWVENYKSEGHYEIQIRGNVTTPQYTDTATIMINSAEMNSEGDNLESKISFARDLLSSNPECQELNELLNQAKQELNKNNYAGTAQIVDNVINGCKYLVNNAKPNIEQPTKSFISLFEWKSAYNQYLIIALFGIMFIISLYYIFKKDNPEQEF